MRFPASSASTGVVLADDPPRCRFYAVSALFAKAQSEYRLWRVKPEFDLDDRPHSQGLALGFALLAHGLAVHEDRRDYTLVDAQEEKPKLEKIFKNVIALRFRTD